MGAASFELDRDGIGEILRSSDMADVVREAADGVADELRSRGVADVYVDPYVSDRAGAVITIAQSRADELVNGVLVDAATAYGLDVRAYRA